MTFSHHHPYLLTTTPADLAGLNLKSNAKPMAPALAAAWLDSLRNGQPFPLIMIEGSSATGNAQALATFLWLWNNHKVEGLALCKLVDKWAAYKAADNPTAFQLLQDWRDWLLKAPVVVWRIPA